MAKPSDRKGAQLRLAERKREAYRLSIAGYTYREISRTLGVSPVQVGKYIRGALANTEEISAAQTAQLRQIQYDRIQAMWKKIFAKVATSRDLLASIQTGIRLLDREAKLMGLDAPMKVDIEAKVRAMAIQDGFDPDEAVEVAFKEIKAGVGGGESSG